MNIIKHSKKILKLCDVTFYNRFEYKSELFNLNIKRKMIQDIILKNPHSMDLGSISSLHLYKYAKDYSNTMNKDSPYKPINFYLEVTDLQSFDIAYKNGVSNFSYTTSVSYSFQQQNRYKSLKDSNNEFGKIMGIIDNKNRNTYIKSKVKLYISCIDDNDVDNIYLINKILYYYYTYNLEEICLSDTYGKLKFSKFALIIRELEKKQINMDKIGLQLHNLRWCNNTSDIISYAMKKGISKFDVSYMPDFNIYTNIFNTDDNNKYGTNLSYNQMYDNIL